MRQLLEQSSSEQTQVGLIEDEGFKNLSILTVAINLVLLSVIPSRAETNALFLAKLVTLEIEATDGSSKLNRHSQK